MKKNIKTFADFNALHESEATVEKMLEDDIKDLYREQVKQPAFMKGGLKTGKPAALQVLQKMKRLIDKYTTSEEGSPLVLRPRTEIRD